MLISTKQNHHNLKHEDFIINNKIFPQTQTQSDCQNLKSGVIFVVRHPWYQCLKRFQCVKPLKLSYPLVSSSSSVIIIASTVKWEHLDLDSTLNWGLNTHEWQWSERYISLLYCYHSYLYLYLILILVQGAFYSYSYLNCTSKGMIIDYWSWGETMWIVKSLEPKLCKLWQNYFALNHIFWAEIHIF